MKGSCPSSSYCGSDMRAPFSAEQLSPAKARRFGFLEFYGYDLADFNTYFKNVKQTNKVPIHAMLHRWNPPGLPQFAGL